MLKEHALDAMKDLYLDNLDLYPRTVKAYESNINQYILYLKRNHIKEPKRSNIIKYKRYMLNQKLSYRTVRKRVIVLKNFYKWLRISVREFGLDEKYLYDICEGIRNESDNTSFAKEPLTLKEAQFLATMAKARATTIVGKRNYCIVLLMITTGLRVIEISRALKSDLRIYRGLEVLYIHGKGRHVKEEFVKVSKEVKLVIDEYLFLRSDTNPYLFTNYHNYKHSDQLSPYAIEHAIKKLLVDTKLYSKKITPHSLRHTCAVLNLESGGTIQSTQMLLRHRNISTTLIYAHNIFRITDQSVERISGNLFKGVKEDDKEYK